MARTLSRVVLAVLLTMGATAQAQVGGSSALDAPAATLDRPPESQVPAADEIPSDAPGLTLQSALIDRILSPLSQADDPDGQINTDRPTFTPANTVVPKGRLQFESGFTFDYQQTRTTRSPAYDFPELAMRVGIAKRVEFRTFWLGQTYSQILSRSGGRPTQLNGPSDMEIGFKWQLLEGNKDALWIPTTALITSVYAPTGGTSPFSSENVDPYINLIYGWTPNEKLTIAGSTGYLERREHFAPRPSRRSDSFERYHQSLVAFYSVGERTTLFYEWYILMPTGAPENRVMSYMDGGVLYHPTPNTQVDLRVGFGLNGNPEEIFTGAGFSVRF
jgi:hypothetical protein